MRWLTAVLLLACDGGDMARGQGERFEADGAQYVNRKEAALAAPIRQQAPTYVARSGSATAAATAGRVGDAAAAVGYVYRDVSTGTFTVVATPAISNVRISAGVVNYDVTLPAIPAGYSNVRAIPVVNGTVWKMVGATAGGISGGKQLMTVSFWDPTTGVVDAGTIGFSLYIHVDFLFY